MNKEITKEELMSLYVEKNLTDKEIAKIFSVSVGKICNLRKQYDIKGINAQCRKYLEHPQNPITSKQMEIIMGSLLGDCCIKPNSRSAYLTISHTIKQKDYIDWLYSELKTIAPTPPKEYISKGKYITYSFNSESRSDLEELRSKIYVPTKRISEWWLNQITALGLAIWYMDDGSLNYVNKSKFNCSFATNSFTEAENYLLSKTLKDKFNIISEVKPYNKKSGIQYNIFISDESLDRFREVISPYILPSMRYKIFIEEKKERAIGGIECSITRDTLDRLYNKDLFTQEQIAQFFSVHKSTIRKYMDLFNIEQRDNTSAQLGGKNNKCSRNQDGQFKPLDITPEQEEKALAIFSQMKSNGFPYIEIKDDEHYVGILDRLMNLNVLIGDNGVFNDYSRSGMDICSAYCPQIFSMATIGSLSPIEIFSNESMLFDCVRRTIKYAGKETIAAVRQGLKTYRNNRCVTIFPPMWGKTAIRYCFPDSKNLSVLDFSCGFGGRLIGSYCSGQVSRYCGIDPLSSNLDSNLRISKLIDKHAVLKGLSFSYELTLDTAENFLSKSNGKYDIILTSPPYFAKEIYSRSDTQCYNKYSDYQTWKDKWLEPVLKSSYNLLNINGVMIIFAGDYDKHSVGYDCCNIMKKFNNVEPICLKFSLPCLEYLRSKNTKKYDTAWIVKKL